jgi:MYXO-CTERM domain-containing protein
MGGTILTTDAPIVSTEGTVVLVGDSDVFSDPVALGGCPHGPDNQRFFQNLYTSLPDPLHGMTMGGGDGGMSMADGGVTMMGGGLGTSCVASTDCASGTCIDDQGVRYCTMTCTGACPGPYTCDDLGGQRLCIAPRGGGCSVSHGASSSAGPLALALALALVLRARRQPAWNTTHARSKRRAARSRFFTST